jgi:hypothetical protein
MTESNVIQMFETTRIEEKDIAADWSLSEPRRLNDVSPAEWDRISDISLSFENKLK